ncbi:hypothetical protein C8R46DRAFT_1093166 [Mycena filopes]|nr:hypothetical protein C8R46DRAFT_1093166 [Mycena filopes]
MHLPLAFLFLFLLPLLSAAPASLNAVDSASAITPTSSRPTESLENASSTPRSTQTGKGGGASVSAHTTHKPPVGASKTATPHTQTVPGGQITRPASLTRLPGPTASHTRPHERPPHHQSMAIIVFEVLGALAGVAFVLSVVRCFWSYNRTPARDRIAAVMHRHQLQREMEELERNPPERHQSLREPPPPPYIRPPSYDGEGDESRLLTSSGASPPPTPHPPLPSRPNG